MQSEGHDHERTESAVIIKISVIKARMPFICLKNKKVLEDENKSLQNAIQIFPQDARTPAEHTDVTRSHRIQ
jgi:hypothetical protein